MEWNEIYSRLSRDRNDPDTWRLLQRAIRSWAQAALRQRGHEVVEDAVADTCATIAINFHRASGAETFRGFALGVFYNARRRALQANMVVRESLDGIDVAAPAPDEGPDPDDLATLRMGMLALPLRERKALLLRYFEEMSAAQIGAELGVTEVNARRIVCNGLTRLRQHFDACGRRSPARASVDGIGQHLIDHLVAGSAPHDLRAKTSMMDLMRQMQTFSVEAQQHATHRTQQRTRRGDGARRVDAGESGGNARRSG